MKNFGILLGILSVGLVVVAFVGISSVDNYGSIAQLQAETNEILMDLFIVIVALIFAVFSGTLLVVGNFASGTSSGSTDSSETADGENLKEQNSTNQRKEPIFELNDILMPIALVAVVSGVVFIISIVFD